MRTRLHLVSPPWAYPWYASLQLGILQGYVDQEFGKTIETRSYSAFLDILYRFRGASCLHFFEQFKSAGEGVYFLIYHSRYLRDKVPVKKAELRSYLKGLNDNCGTAQSQENPLSFSDLESIEKHTLAYVDEVIVPELIDDGVNVIGFTMNFFQVYSSLVMAKMIQERAPKKKVLFLFGGFSPSLPNIFALMAQLEIPGYAIFGEGEERLAAILRDVEAQKTFTGELTQEISGVFRIREGVDLFKRDESLFRSQLKDLDALPLPDLDEYFSLRDRLCETDPIFSRFMPAVLPFEGSRGCFAKCDFCNMNLQWAGFRKMSADQVLTKVRELQSRYNAKDISFVDNVCDTWAEKFADGVIGSGEKYRFYMDLRAHHPEIFWAKLAAAGMDTCLVGIEAISAPLLGHMSKGTSVIQNFKVLKSLTEFGVHSFCGLIMKHPRATRQDALETQRVLDHICHLEPLEPRPYYLGLGSPLFDRLDPELKRGLKSFSNVPPPAALSPYVASGGFEVPAEYQLPAEEQRLWEDIHQRCLALMRLPAKERPTFTVARQGDGSLKIADSRFKTRQLRLSGLRARLFDLCHDGLTLEFLEQRSGLPRAEFLEELEALVEQKLIMKSEEHYITLALRPRAECFERLGLQDGVTPKISNLTFPALQQSF